MTPPPAYKIMLVKMKTTDNTTVRKAVEVRAILTESMFKGDYGILCFTGLVNTYSSLVFYVAEGNVGPMIQRMLHEEKYYSCRSRCSDICHYAKVDIATAGIIPDLNVTEHMYFTKVYICTCTTSLFN